MMRTEASAADTSAPSRPTLFGGWSACSTDPHELDRAAQDFGGLVSQRPAAVVRAETADDVVRALRLALDAKVPVAARGRAHTTRGQAQVRGGLVIDMTGLDHVRIEGDCAVVGAGARWDALLAATLQHGLTPPTLTDYLGLSVGGTLAVGGFGGQSFRHGAQTDNVEWVRLFCGVLKAERARSLDVA